MLKKLFLCRNAQLRMEMLTPIRLIDFYGRTAKRAHCNKDTSDGDRSWSGRNGEITDFEVISSKLTDDE